MSEPARKVGNEFGRIWPSFITKLAILLTTFVTVPMILYLQFEAADEEKKSLLLKNVQDEGRLILQGLVPLLESFEEQSTEPLHEAMGRLRTGNLKVKLLFRPRHAEQESTFFYVASTPAVSTDYLQKERRDLIEAGIFEKLLGTCEGNRALATRYTNPAGDDEVLTSITPFNTAAGCWVVITSHEASSLFGSSVGQPYWKAPEVRLAAGIYLAMALIVIALFFGIRRSLSRFERLARAIRTEGESAGSFAQMNRMPELDGVAEEFDRVVHRLRESAQHIRQAAEENAHALKAPLAVISQSIEPLKRSIPQGDQRRERAVELIERSVLKLDALVSAARQMEMVAAESIDPPQQRLDASSLLERMLGAYAESMAESNLRLHFRLESGLVILANEELVETVVENLLENAISFSPAGGFVTVDLRRHERWAELVVEDQGKGVDPQYLGTIFERYFSQRPPDALELAVEDMAEDMGNERHTHFGIGLWIVRRNAEAVGGSVSARNSPYGGLRVTVRFPLVR